MSLVDYAASSDEDEPQTPAVDEEENVQVEENPEKRQRFEGPAPAPSTSAPPNHLPIHAHHRTSTSLRPPSSKPMETGPDQSPVLKLPDASFLLNSPVVPQSNASDHSSRVAAAMAESAARKRDLNGSAATYPRSKVPKGALPHSKSVPETVAGRLVPPQLSGRSNVVTEDISKLFVRKHTADSATE
ncbi:hypothetical protein C2S52_009794 [Perilla frutescens var. hirtella]|nr:hypothetical protein C2S52_009794 [Perilla frutescens var. hirtella]